MTLPNWYLDLIAWFVLACGFVGAICVAAAVTWWCIEWSLNYFALHQVFLEFMEHWVHKRQERREAGGGER